MLLQQRLILAELYRVQLIAGQIITLPLALQPAEAETLPPSLLQIPAAQHPAAELQTILEEKSEPEATNPTSFAFDVQSNPAEFAPPQVPQTEAQISDYTFAPTEESLDVQPEAKPVHAEENLELSSPKTADPYADFYYQTEEKITDVTIQTEAPVAANSFHLQQPIEAASLQPEPTIEVHSFQIPKPYEAEKESTPQVYENQVAASPQEFSPSLAPLEKARTVRTRTAGSILPTVLTGLRMDSRRTEAEVVKVWNHLIDPAILVGKPCVKGTRLSIDFLLGLLAQGWIDSTRYLHPEKKIYTFWVNGTAFRRNAGFRMDFLLLNPALAPRLLEAGVDTEFRGREGASDHAPTWITLSYTGRAATPRETGAKAAGSS